MTKKLDELFNMSQEAAKKLEESKELTVVDNNNVPAERSDVNQLILDLSEVHQHETDMDALAVTAMDGYEKIVEMAENAEPKDVSRLLDVAAVMLKNAIDAKNSKVRARLKAGELLIRKKQAEANEELPDAEVVDNEEGTIRGDRNKILDIIQQKDTKKE